MIYRKNCCYSLKQTEFKTVWPLIREHQIIECHILCLREAIIEKDFEVVSTFIKFCKTCLPAHFSKEEQVVFLLLARHLPFDDELIPFLINDHNEDIKTIYEIEKEFLEFLDSKDAASWSSISRRLISLVDSVGKHAELENKTIMKLSEKLLSKEEKAFLIKKFQEIGAYS